MSLFFIEYDLRKARNYDPLWAELQRFCAVRVLKSSWCFNATGWTATTLRDHFKQFIDADHGLIVSEVSDWASVRVINSPNKLVA